MPQISPLSWVLIPFLFVTFLFMVMIGVWWLSLGGYSGLFSSSTGGSLLPEGLPSDSSKEKV